MNFRTRRQADDIELNFVPLIDVLVVLLIFLMVTTSFSRLGQLKVELPQASSDPLAAGNATLELVINGAGEYSIGGESIGVGELAHLTAALRRAASGRTAPVLVISADRGTPHERVIMAMTAAREAGIDNLSFAVESAGALP